MYNVKAAVSRLDFGPEPEAMEVTDIATGHFVFEPVSDKRVSYEGLNEAIENAGYEIGDATITVSGISTDEKNLKTPVGQIFHLRAANESVGKTLAEIRPREETTVRGGWETVEGVEVVTVVEVERAGAR